MSKVYITGHRNPDLDSLCAALSYARLKNLTDPDNEYIAVHCSPVSDSVRRQMEEMELRYRSIKRMSVPKSGMSCSHLRKNCRQPILSLI